VNVNAMNERLYRALQIVENSSPSLLAGHNINAENNESSSKTKINRFLK
jgi:hypothetical protein